MAELGAGGGQGDLDMQHELEVYDTDLLGQLLSFCTFKLQDQPKLLANIGRMIASLLNQPMHSVAIDASALIGGTEDLDNEDIAELDQMPLENLVPVLTKLASSMKDKQSGDSNTVKLPNQSETLPAQQLPKRIVSNLKSLHLSSHMLMCSDLPVLTTFIVHRALPPGRSFPA
jgi:hypothetical protein